jgi:hypothetical protein
MADRLMESHIRESGAMAAAQAFKKREKCPFLAENSAFWANK